MSTKLTITLCVYLELFKNISKKLLKNTNTNPKKTNLNFEINLQNIKHNLSLRARVSRIKFNYFNLSHRYVRNIIYNVSTS